MIEIRECKTPKEQRRFLNFALNLYKNNPYFVPPLYMDEKKLFSPLYHYHKTCEAIFFNAYKDGKHVGRIQGIISHPSNEKWNQKRVRFTRIDFIDDEEVAHALLKAVEDWGKSKGMTEINGPLGYSDLEREGLLIEGFDQLNTFEEQYNYPYYQKYIESYGLKKEVDWVERRLFPPDHIEPKLITVTNHVLKQNNLHVLEFKTIDELIRKYSTQIFDLIDETYNHLYQTVPLTKEQIRELVASFRLICSPKYTRLIVDGDNKLIAFGVCFPAIGKSLQRSGGKLTIPTIIKLLKTIKYPKHLDLGLIGVSQKYQNSGAAWVILLELTKIMHSGKILSCETNLTLEYNLPIQNCFKRFPNIVHKRRRAYIKSIN